MRFPIQKWIPAYFSITASALPCIHSWAHRSHRCPFTFPPPPQGQQHRPPLPFPGLGSGREHKKGNRKYKVR